MDFTPHSLKQENAIFSDHKITALVTGIQFGKTTTGALWLKRMMHTYTDSKDTFIVTAPTYKILEQSTLKSFLSVMEGYGSYNAQKADFRMFGGGTCYFRTQTDPDSIVGITNVRAIWGDEAGLYTLYFWENIQGRASFKNAPIILTSSPYTLNWLYKDLVRQAKSRADLKVFQASSIENPYFPKEEYHRRKNTMDPRRFEAMFGGEFARMHGLVYDCFSETENICDGMALPSGTRYFGGIDWGYTEPFVLLIVAMTPAGNFYVVSEFYKTGQTITDILQICHMKKKTFDIEMFYCGKDQPGYIEEMNRHGLISISAENDVRRGIDRVYDVLKTRRLKLFKGSSPHLLDELDTYHYPEPKDLKPDQDVRKEKPVEQNDHACDALRYFIASKYRAHEIKAPKLPGETEMTQEERIEHLKKKNRNRNSENWS